MSVGNLGNTGINQKVAATQANKQNTTANQNASARNAALAKANAPANTAAPVVTTAVAAPGAPAAAAIGVTTAPAARGFTAAPQAPAAVQAQAMAQAALLNPAVLAALFGASVATTKTKATRGIGDAKEDSGNVEVETQSEAQPDALVDSNQEMGAGEITEASSMSGPAT